MPKAGRKVLTDGVRREKTAPRMRRSPGIPVALCSAVRRFFLAWLTLALFLLALGRLSHAGDELALGGFLTGSEQEADDGYFNVGADTMLVVRQGSGLHRWLKTHSGRQVRITIEPEPGAP